MNDYRAHDPDRQVPPGGVRHHRPSRKGQDPEEAEHYAWGYARRHQRPVCLAVSRRLSVWINQQGEVEARTEATPDQATVPLMRLKGARHGFLWSFSGKGSRVPCA